MTKICYAALDIGTSRIKIAVWTDQGIKILASRACPLNQLQQATLSSAPHAVCVSWSQLRSIVEELLQRLGAYCTAHQVEDLQLGLCGQVSSILVWDTVTNQVVDDVVPIWLDRQCATSVDLLQEIFSKQQLQEELGTCLPLACNWLLVKLHHYLRENKIKIDLDQVKFLQLHDAVYYILSNEFKTHPSAQVSITQNEDLCYAEPILRELGLSADNFPTMSSNGSDAILDAQCEKFSLPQQSRVAVGLADMYAGFNGFFLEAGELLWQCNTSEIIGYCGEADAQDVLPRQRLGDEWIYYGSTNSGGHNINWFLEQHAAECSLDELSEQASKIPAGSEGLLYLPFLSGERAPHWNSSLSSAFIGLQPQHSKAHMFRAVLEGVAFNKRHILSLLPQHAARCKIAGGSSVNQLWNEIRAHVIGVPLQRIAETEVALLGVLRFVATMNGDNKTVADLQTNLCTDLIPVNDALRQTYDQYYQLYFQAQQAIRPVMQKLGGLGHVDVDASQPAVATNKEFCDA